MKSLTGTDFVLAGKGGGGMSEKRISKMINLGLK